MNGGWDKKIKTYRIRHGLTQAHMGNLLGVSQRTISRWERGDDKPGIARQKRLRDLGWAPSSLLFTNLATSIAHCPAPRALTRTQKLNLQTLSKPALEKRPSIQEWIGRDLAKIACGVLEEMLDDKPLQKAILKREIACIVTTSQSVLRTPESESVGTYRTTINYFFHEGTLYSDAISVPIAADTDLGYTPITMDDFTAAI